MKRYAIYIVDKYGIGGEVKCEAQNKAEAMKKAREYIRAWQLGPAKIEYCKQT